MTARPLTPRDILTALAAIVLLWVFACYAGGGP